jgi:hypothetical protein
VPGIEKTTQISDGPYIYLVQHDFLSDRSDFLINVAESCLSRSLVGGDIEIAGRTSTAATHEQSAWLDAEGSVVDGSLWVHCGEYPQVAKCVTGQQYGQHYVSFSNLGGLTGRKGLSLGATVRLITVLIYLNNVGWGGKRTLWTDLRIHD